MNKLIFSPDMFPSGENSEEISTEVAQQAFDEWYAENIESAPTLRGFKLDSGRWLWDSDDGKLDTHKAKLVCIEEIK